MARRRYTKVHMRCTSDGCRRRFKAIPLNDHPCPFCGKTAKPDGWAAKKPWNDKLCNCGAWHWSSELAHHRLGSSRHGVKCLGPIEPPEDLPGVPGDYPF